MTFSFKIIGSEFWASKINFEKIAMVVWQKWQVNHMPREEKRNFMRHVVPVISSNYLDLMTNLECNFDPFLEIAQTGPAALAKMMTSSLVALMTSSLQKTHRLDHN